MTLGQLIGRIKNGGAAAGGAATALQGFKEDRRNAAKSVHPLYYGAFSSYGPAYDSTFANLTKQVSNGVNGLLQRDGLLLLDIPVTRRMEIKLNISCLIKVTLHT